MNILHSQSNRKSTTAELGLPRHANWSLSRGVVTNVLSVLSLLAVYVLAVSAVRLLMAAAFSLIGSN